MNISLSLSAEGLVSLNGTMLTFNSLKSPDMEHIDNGDAFTVTSIERKACNHFHM